MRDGYRAASATVVVHVLRPASSVAVFPQPARFGLVVGRTVGNSVVRHRVSRRLRGLLAARAGRVPAGADIVVRARAQAASSTSARLGADLDVALASALRRVAGPPRRSR
jgi:ribonuclease P protein component